MWGADKRTLLKGMKKHLDISREWYIIIRKTISNKAYKKKEVFPWYP